MATELQPTNLVSELRDRIGMTQEQFARTLQVTVHAIRNWEQGRRSPDLKSQQSLEAFDLLLTLLDHHQPIPGELQIEPYTTMALAIRQQRSRQAAAAHEDRFRRGLTNNPRPPGPAYG